MNTTNPNAIPAPKTVGFSDEFSAAWERDMAILEADPRTTGGYRPSWLVKRVLADHAAKAGK